MSDESPKPPPSLSDSLAQTRTDLAMERTRIAADRTLMAWIRTSLSMISFGFSIYKFFQYLRESEGVGRLNGPRNFGLTLIVLGILILPMATWEHTQMLRELVAEGAKPKWSFARLVALILTAIGALAFANVLLRWGPF